jgi:hypothetical protein
LKISKCKLFGSALITHPAGKALVAVTKFIVWNIGVQLLCVAFGDVGYTMVA